jgi:hypothetical protein
MKNIFLTLIFTCLVTNQGFSQDNEERISIGFYSICCGTPDGKPIFDYIKTFKKANKIKDIQATLISGLGREGEHEYRFTLKELTKSQRIKFISKIKTICSDFEKKRNPNQDGGMTIQELNTKELRILRTDEDKNSKIVHF